MLLDMGSKPLNYQEIYEAARQRLAQITDQEAELEREKLQLRQTIEFLLGLLERHKVPVEQSIEAVDALNSSLAKEVGGVLSALYPKALKVSEVLAELKQLGRNLGEYSNAQSAVQMVLKRLVEADEAEELPSGDLKKTYRALRGMEKVLRQSARNREGRKLSTLMTEVKLSDLVKPFDK
jgi:chromosome segregation ATPase